MYSILVCDDDKDIVAAIKIYLESEGYGVITAYDGKEALEKLSAEDVHLVLMDIMMPVMDGISAMVEIRRRSNVPVILLTAKSEDTDKVLGLNVGADDYITKPFGTAELLARLRTALRHAHRAESIRSSKTPFRADGLLVDYDKRRVLVDGEEIHFTQKEFNLISLLSVHAGRVLTYDFLMRNIWGTVPADSENSILRVNMASIRRKIEKDPAEPKYILTEMGVGYRMIEGD